MKKKSQTEIMGLAIIIILIIIGTTFVIRFIMSKEPADYKKDFTHSELAINMINTFLETTSASCKKLSMTELLQDCGQNPDDPSIKCTASDTGSCSYVEQEAEKIFKETLEKWGTDYVFKVFLDDEDSPIIFLPKPVKECPDNKKSKLFPIPITIGSNTEILSVKLDICE